MEGAFGQKARDHFFALRNILPELRGLEIIDSDNRGLLESSAGGFSRLPWKRYELENYLITPDLLMEWMHVDGADLFADHLQAILDGLLLEKIFDNNQADFENYSQANTSTQNTIWRAQTQTRKLSLFAEEFFRRCATATGTPIPLRKGDLYQLIHGQPIASIDPEIIEKLDAILDLLTVPAFEPNELA